jgi:hypothetical protein
MRFRSRIAIILITLATSFFAYAQARTLITSVARSIIVPAKPGSKVILGSVLLGQPRAFSMFNIRAAGTITPDPDLNGAAFQLEFLICDQPDCSGDLHLPMRILPDADTERGAQLLATRSFGVSTHSVDPVMLTDIRPRSVTGILFLAASLKVLHSPATPAFSAKLNLLRVDVLP